MASPSAREGSGITFIETMAADEVIADAGFLVDPTVDSLREMLDAALGGTRPPTSPVDCAQEYDWERVTEQAENAYQRAVNGTW